MKNKYYTPTTHKFTNHTQYALVSPFETLHADLEDGSRHATNFREYVTELMNVLNYYAPRIKQTINIEHVGDETHIAVTFALA